MLKTVLSIDRVDRLYIQLLYRCNFRCKHCFHGEALELGTIISAEDIDAILRYFRENYELRAVTLLGGEPFMHPEIVAIVNASRGLGLTVDICTNGHSGFKRRLAKCHGDIDMLRVSLDGLREAHDYIRRPGSFDGAMRTVAFARSLGVRVGVTLTVTRHNVMDLAGLADLLEAQSVDELKLHEMRIVGNAARHPELRPLPGDGVAAAVAGLQRRSGRLAIVVDSDLARPDTGGAPEPKLSRERRIRSTLDRAEFDPRGNLTMSCKAVGLYASAFRWDFGRKAVVHSPHLADELALAIPDVVYQNG
jgi:MoaA/NifB/PqqE/SkfB family radical SAM enzyme